MIYSEHSVENDYLKNKIGVKTNLVTSCPGVVYEMVL